MNYSNSVLLLGVALNFYGAAKLGAQGFSSMLTAPNQNGDGLQYQLFVAGTAAVFGSIYLYLYFHPSFVVPFLIFGAALKTWACLLSLLLYRRQLVSRSMFLEFGLTNGVIASLFWVRITT